MRAVRLGGGVAERKYKTLGGESWWKIAPIMAAAAGGAFARAEGVALLTRVFGQFPQGVPLEGACLWKIRG